MNLTLQRPSVVGTLDLETLRLITFENAQQKDRPLYTIPKDLLPLYKEISRQADTPFFLENLALGRIDTVEPGKKQIPGNSEWHVDGSHQFLVADELPTEILVGDSTAVQSFCKFFEHNYHIENPQNSPYINSRLQKGLQESEIPDEELKEFGFRVWNAEPGEIIHITTELHRTPTNNTSLPITRRLAALTLY